MSDPRRMPGYRAALAAGRLPSVPETPPAVRLPNSNTITLKCVTLALAALLGLLVGIRWPWVVALHVLLLIGIAGYVVTRVVGLRLREYDAGYCRTRTWVGAPAGTVGPKGSAARSERAWDARGLWLLGAKNEVVEPPVPGVLPPGWYPSRDAGMWDIWTGVEWVGSPTPTPGRGVGRPFRRVSGG